MAHLAPWALRTARALLALAVLPLLAASPAGAHPGHDATLTHFGWLKDLAGSCWKGDHPDGRTSDTQCFEIQFGHFLFSTIRLSELRDGKWEPSFEGASVFVWDSKAQRIGYWYWTSTGAFGPADVLVEGDRFHFPASRRPGARSLEVRSTWERLDNDSYRVSRQRREGGDWKEMFAVVYRRVPRRP